MTGEEAERYTGFQVVCGHISRADQLRWFGHRDIITVLRAPIDRCLSFVHYARSLPPGSFPAATEANRLAPIEFIYTAPALENVHNTMVRQLGGHILNPHPDFLLLLDAAKETLRQAVWVGRQEHLQVDLLPLSSVIGHVLTDVRENVTPARPPISKEDKSLIDRLRELNEFDLKLWEWAHERLF